MSTRVSFIDLGFQDICAFAGPLVDRNGERCHTTSPWSFQNADGAPLFGLPLLGGLTVAFQPDQNSSSKHADDTSNTQMSLFTGSRSTEGLPDLRPACAKFGTRTTHLGNASSSLYSYIPIPWYLVTHAPRVVKRRLVDDGFSLELSCKSA